MLQPNALCQGVTAWSKQLIVVFVFILLKTYTTLMPHILLIILISTLQQAEMRTIRWLCGIKVTDQIKQDEMKDKSRTEYFSKSNKYLGQS